MGHTISGGELDIVEAYDPATDTWETKTPMPVARRATTCGVIDDKIYVAGGSPTSWWGSNTNKLEVYDPATDTWDVTKEDMPKSLFGPKGAVLGDKFYLVGGLHSGTWTGQKWVQIYDPATNSWELGPNLINGRFAHSVEVVGDKLYVIGGTDVSGGGSLDIIEEVEVYDPTEDTSWSKVDITPVLFKVHASSVYKDIIYSFSGGRMGGTNMTPVSDVYSYTPPAESATLAKGSFEFEGRIRNYEVYLPQDYKPNMPVVFALHGYSETIKWFKDYTLFHEYADTSGFILVYPQGSIASNGQPGWNTGLRNHPFGLQNTTSNDVGFLSTLIDTLDKYYDIDLDRVYCCGYSMGGEMSYRMAIEYGHLFAAYASVSGKLNDISANLGPPLHSYPILHFHGTADNVETYDGENDGNLWPVEKTINFWLDNNSCAYQADTISLPDLSPNDGSIVQKISHKNCLDENNVVFYKIINGGHGWPGSTEGMYSEGKPNRDIYASSIILNFFKNYDNPHVNLAYGKAIKCNTKFISPINNNKLDLVATIHNPENHQVEAHATILLGDSVITDSIKLYDDGSHNDEIALDNVFSSQISAASFGEDFYKIKLYTTDHDESITIVCSNEDYFTTAGPIEFGFTDIDTLSDGRIALKNFELVNRGNKMTVENIEAELTTLDTNIEFTSSLRYFGDITAGGSKTIPAAFAFFAEDDAQLIEFEIKIKCNNIEYWTDSFMLDIPNLTDLDNESTRYIK